MRHYAFKKKRWLWAAKVIDAVGYLFNRPPSSKPLSPKRILVVRLDHLGDVVLSLPVFKNLKASFPDAVIDALTIPAGGDLLQAAGVADTILTWNCPWLDSRRSDAKSLPEILADIKRNKYDCVLELRGDIRLIWLFWRLGIPAIVGYGATGGGFLLDVEVPWEPSAHAVDKNLRLVAAIGGKVDSPVPSLPGAAPASRPIKKILIHPDAGTEAKLWPRERFVDLINKIGSVYPGVEMAIIGLDHAGGENMVRQTHVNLKNMMGKTSLPQLIDLMRTSDFLITNDSGPAHLMAALAKPTLIIWSGTADPDVWAPRGENIALVRHPVPCAPCSLSECPVPGHPCLSEISVDDVMRSVNSFFP